MKSFAKFAIVGVTSVVLFKLFATILLPLFALMVGLLGLALKLALIAVVGYFIYSLFCKSRRDRDEHEVEIEVS